MMASCLTLSSPPPPPHPILRTTIQETKPQELWKATEWWAVLPRDKRYSSPGPHDLEDLT